MAFCTNCGAQVQQGAGFCQACGQAMAAAPAPPPTPQYTQQPSPPVPQPIGQPPSMGQPARQSAPAPQSAQQPFPQQQAQPPYPRPAQQAPSHFVQQTPPQPVQQIPVQPMRQASPPPPGQSQAYQPPVVPGAPRQADIQDAQQNKTMAWLSYLLFFIPLLTGAHKTSPFVRFHANQGTVLFLAALAGSIVLGILSAILTGIFTAALNLGAILAVSSIFGIVSIVYGVFITVLAVVGILNAVNGRTKPLPVIGRFAIIK